MLRVIYVIETKEIVQVLDSTDGETTFDQSTRTMIQGSTEEVIAQAEVVGIDIDALMVLLTANDVTVHANRLAILRDRNKGYAVITDLNIALRNEVINATLTKAQVVSILTTIHLAITILLVGDLQGARMVVNAINVAAPFNNARKNWLLDRIDQEINN